MWERGRDNRKYLGRKEMKNIRSLLVVIMKHDLKGMLTCTWVEICTHHHNPPPDVTDITSSVQSIVCFYKVVQEKLISLWENWKALG
jgi:hypothetical protein